MNNNYRCDRYEELSPSEQRIMLNKKRRLKIVRRQRLILLAAVIAVVFLFMSMFMKMSLVLSAQSRDITPTCKYYKVVSVHAGDTLESLATKYYANDKYGDFSSYISEICSINHLDDPDVIKAGENVVIPYYDEYR